MSKEKRDGELLILCWATFTRSKALVLIQGEHRVVCVLQILRSPLIVLKSCIIDITEEPKK
jgi:hypothetical protein